ARSRHGRARAVVGDAVRGGSRRSRAGRADATRPALLSPVRTRRLVLELELEAVVGELDVVIERALLGPVGDEEAVCAGGAERLERLLQREMAARLRLVMGQRRLADEQVRVAGELREGVARPRVTRV